MGSSYSLFFPTRPQRPFCEEYVGEKLRAVSVQKKEPRDAIRLVRCEKSSLAGYVHVQSAAHETDWKSLWVIDRADRTIERRVRESFHIRMRNPKINRNVDIERSAMWDAVLVEMDKLLQQHHNITYSLPQVEHFSPWTFLFIYFTTITSSILNSPPRTITLNNLTHHCKL